MLACRRTQRWRLAHFVVDNCEPGSWPRCGSSGRRVAARFRLNAQIHFVEVMIGVGVKLRGAIEVTPHLFFLLISDVLRQMLREGNKTSEIDATALLVSK